jgi:hypothetical protein
VKSNGKGGGQRNNVPKAEKSKKRRRALEGRKQGKAQIHMGFRNSSEAYEAGAWCRGALSKRSHSAWAATFSLCWKSSSSSSTVGFTSATGDCDLESDQNASVGEERPSDMDESSEVDDDNRLGAALDRMLRLIDWRLFWNQIVTDLSSLVIAN